MIAALPEQVTEDNADDVRAQLDEILALYRELTEDEQEQIDLSCIYALQGALDNANAPMTADDHTEQQDTDEASVTTNGETLYYATLKEAFDAANGKTATITMLNNAECIKSDSSGSPLSITGGTVTLDMNGKTLSGEGRGNYGIVNVSGGSLLVQGKGTVKVTNMGLSCRGGKLTVADTNFELIGNGMFYSNTAVCNWGGTIIINGGKIIGPGSYGQIHQYSGNTTINNITATESDKSQPDSVRYYNDGTLTINMRLSINSQKCSRNGC